MSGASGIVRMDAHDSNQAPELRPLHLSVSVIYRAIAPISHTVGVRVATVIHLKLEAFAPFVRE